MRVLAAVCVLSVLSGRAIFAQPDTFTQVGSVACGNRAGGWLCDSVTFPQEFGANPTIIISLNQLTLIPGPATGERRRNYVTTVMNVSAGAANVTPKGFTPTISFDPPWQSNPANQNSNGEAMHINSLTWVAVGSRLYRGTATPKYAILTVIYAPPGANGGRGMSSVSYGAGVTTGTTISATQSFQSTVGTSVTAKIGSLGASGQGSLSFDFSDRVTDKQSVDVKLSTMSTIQRPGPAQDGIQHDEDAIYLLLRPKVDVALSSTAAAWTFGDNSQSHIQYVFVGELNGHYQWRPGVLQELQAAGITPSDYPDILASDPLASGASDVDPVRYIPLNTMFPYEAPPTPNDPVMSITTVISSSSTTTTGSTRQSTYKVGMTISGSAGFLGIAESTFKNTSSWEWTNTSEASISSGSTQSASVTIGGPSYGYPGVTEIRVYRDSIYNTFAFVLVPPESMELAVKGSVVDNMGKASAGTEVVLVENGVTHRTFTDSRGDYKFFGHITGPAILRAAGITQTLQQPTSERTIQFRLQ